MSSIKKTLDLVDSSKQKEALSLIAHFLKKDLSYILAHLDLEISRKDYKQITSSLKQLNLGYPLAYIKGEKYFYSRRYSVNEDVLIPRPESELILDLVLKQSSKNDQRKIFLDIGTGSGALIITLAKELEERRPKQFKTSIFMASDISKSALKVAKNNAVSFKLEQKIVFKHGNLVEPFSKSLGAINKEEIYLLANLPYLSPSERQTEASIRFEPDLALLSGEDGLYYYRKLLPQLAKIILPNKYFLIMEINPHQEEILRDLAKVYFPEDYIKKEPDLSGRTRFIIISNI